MLYGAAEYSRDIDLAVLATDSALPKLAATMQSLRATVIAVPPFEAQYLERGHAVHFNVPDPDGAYVRVDLMSRMRGVDEFPELWNRRTSVTLPTADGDAMISVTVELLGLEDLVRAKKTQRDKDWPMLRRLVDASYDAGRDGDPSPTQIDFWLTELRTPEFLREAVARFPEVAAQLTRPAVRAALADGDIVGELAAEQSREMALDRAYWEPLRRELEALRHVARRR